MARHTHTRQYLHLTFSSTAISRKIPRATHHHHLLIVLLLLKTSRPFLIYFTSLFTFFLCIPNFLHTVSILLLLYFILIFPSSFLCFQALSSLIIFHSCFCFSSPPSGHAATPFLLHTPSSTLLPYHHHHHHYYDFPSVFALLYVLSLLPHPPPRPSTMTEVAWRVFG